MIIGFFDFQPEVSTKKPQVATCGKLAFFRLAQPQATVRPPGKVIPVDGSVGKLRAAIHYPQSLTARDQPSSARAQRVRARYEFLIRFE
jgi:hypothetical protein